MWSRVFSIAGVAVPSFWLGILLILGILIVFEGLVRHAVDAAYHLLPFWVDPLHNLSS